MKDINRQKTEELKTLVDTTLGGTKEQLTTDNIKETVKLMEQQGRIIENKGMVEISVADSNEKRN